MAKPLQLKKTFPDKEYFSFEPPSNREYFNNDPWGFLERFKEGAFFDEVQHVPDLFSYLQAIVDEKNIPGQFIVSGSQNLFINEKIIILHLFHGTTWKTYIQPFCPPHSK